MFCGKRAYLEAAKLPKNSGFCRECKSRVFMLRVNLKISLKVNALVYGDVCLIFCAVITIQIHWDLHIMVCGITDMDELSFLAIFIGATFQPSGYLEILCSPCIVRFFNEEGSRLGFPESLGAIEFISCTG